MLACRVLAFFNCGAAWAANYNLAVEERDKLIQLVGALGMLCKQVGRVLLPIDL